MFELVSFLRAQLDSDVGLPHALSSFFGHKSAQEMRCADVRNRDMSTPISETIAPSRA